MQTNTSHLSFWKERTESLRHSVSPIESHRKPQLTKKNLIFCYEILSKANAFSRMTVKKGNSAIDTNHIKFSVVYLKKKILQSLPLLCAKNLLNTSTMGKVDCR